MPCADAMPPHRSKRPVPTLELETSLHMAGISRVAGLDEAGRGAWAGPVVAAAVMLPLEREDLLQALVGVADSKQLSERKRMEHAEQIRAVARAIGIGAAGAVEVDRFGLLPATRLAMRRALNGLGANPQYLLLDHLILPGVPLDQTALPRGDVHVLSIAAASIIAKVSRDALMREIATAYPEYGFDRHKGYGTWMHRQALEQHGPTPVHRFSYQPVGQLTLDLFAQAAA